MNSPDRSLFLDIGWLAVAVIEVVDDVDHWNAAVALVIMQHLNYRCHPAAMKTKENFKS